MSRIKLCLRILAGVLGALVALSPPASALGPDAYAIASVKPDAPDAAVLATGKKAARASGFVTTATRKLDLSKLDIADFGDVAR